VESSEAKALLETFYSPVFQIFYDTFTSTEATLKQKSKNFLLFIENFVINHFINSKCKIILIFYGNKYRAAITTSLITTSVIFF
jgi:hypothetical protein